MDIDTNGNPIEWRHRQLARSLGVDPAAHTYDAMLVEVSNWREDRAVWNQRIATMMEAIPRNLFAGGTRLDEMVVNVCQRLRDLESDLHILKARYKAANAEAAVNAAIKDLDRLNDLDSDLHQIGEIVAGALTQPIPDQDVADWRQSREKWTAHLENPNENEITTLDIVCVALLDRYEGRGGEALAARYKALSDENDAIRAQIDRNRRTAVENLISWMGGDLCTVQRSLEEQAIRAVGDGEISAEEAIDALRSRRALAILVLDTIIGEDVPF